MILTAVNLGFRKTILPCPFSFSSSIAAQHALPMPLRNLQPRIFLISLYSPCLPPFLQQHSPTATWPRRSICATTTANHICTRTIHTYRLSAYQGKLTLRCQCSTRSARPGRLRSCTSKRGSCASLNANFPAAQRPPNTT